MSRATDLARRVMGPGDPRGDARGRTSISTRLLDDVILEADVYAVAAVILAERCARWQLLAMLWRRAAVLAMPTPESVVDAWLR
ncbi:MAG TPA: hypothetical protein VK607_10540 [Kofleriaceae bacterium]|nr:hypothetical protein [Kofleriaceae bacterium]